MAANSVFHFQQFSVKQDKCAMKVGTDGILLGAWAKPAHDEPTHMLDIGTGTGLIALMLAQRFPASHLEAIELDTSAADQAAQNVAASPFTHQIRVIPQALQDLAPQKAYDLIVSNPPFFVAGNPSPDPRRAAARHLTQLSPAALCAFAQSNLAHKGVLALIWPADSTEMLVERAAAHGLFLRQNCQVRTLADRPAHRCLVSFGQTIVPIQQEEIVIQHPGTNTYTEAYRQLTADFYTIWK